MPVFFCLFFVVYLYPSGGKDAVENKNKNKLLLSANQCQCTLVGVMTTNPLRRNLNNDDQSED